MPKSKKIIVAKTAGFCWGVSRAFNKALDIAEKSEKCGKLYTYGPLIHNPGAVDMLEEKGVKVMGEIPSKVEGAVFIRTHGISPHERAKLKSSGAVIYDVTCPDVGKIQGIVKKHLKRGYNIVIVGNSEHPEVKALLGFAEGQGVCISSVKDISKIPDSWDKICVVAQSTQKEKDYIKITGLLKEKYPTCKVFNTICKATAHRQEEVKELARKVDAMVVVGGFNSANTNKLAQISREIGTPTYHVEGAEEININEFNKFHIVGITAGASTPRWSIVKVVQKFLDNEYEEMEEEVVS